MATAQRQQQRDAAPARADNRAAADGGGTRRMGRGRVAAARGRLAAGGLLVGIARVIRIIVAVVVVIIVAGILLFVLGANTSNGIVKDIHDAARFLVGPFKNVFSIKNPKVSIAVNWGLAAVVWLIVGGFIASLFARAGRRTAAPATAATV